MKGRCRSHENAIWRDELLPPGRVLVRLLSKKRERILRTRHGGFWNRLSSQQTRSQRRRAGLLFPDPHLRLVLVWRLCHRTPLPVCHVSWWEGGIAVRNDGHRSVSPSQKKPGCLHIRSLPLTKLENIKEIL